MNQTQHDMIVVHPYLRWQRIGTVLIAVVWCLVCAGVVMVLSFAGAGVQ